MKFQDVQAMFAGEGINLVVGEDYVAQDVVTCKEDTAEIMTTLLPTTITGVMEAVKEYFEYSKERKSRICSVYTREREFYGEKAMNVHISVKFNELKLSTSMIMTKDIIKYW